MQRHVFLVGTDHRYQRGVAFGVPDSVFADFRAELQRLISEHAIRGLAEEMSHDGLGIHRSAGGSLAFFIARELGLSHRYCDPTRAEREQDSITTLEQRERHWLTELQSFPGFPCLFILGADHVSSFSSLLRDSGFTVSVLVPDWEPDLHFKA